MIAPAAQLFNVWDSRLGGALADAVGANAVVKAFGVEAREDARLGRLLAKWNRRTHRTWMRITLSITAQFALLLTLRTAIVGTAL